MAETKTPNYAWIKPDIGGDATTWGSVLNQTTDAIDSVVYANQQAGVQIGAVIMFAGGTAPTNWFLCQGQSLDTTTYAGLFGVIGYAYGGSAGNFNLPNLQGVFPVGAGNGAQIGGLGLGAMGGEANHTLGWNEMPVHGHPISQTPHTHPGSYQNAHNHGIVTGNHSHNIATGNHSHGTQLLRFVGSGGQFGITGGGPNVNMGNTDGVGNLGGNTDTAGNLGGNTDTQQPGVGIAGDTAQIPGNATGNAGGGAGHNTVPPYIALNFIIRFA